MPDLWYPNAVHRPLSPEASSQPIIIPRLAVFHTNGSPNSVSSLFSYYNRIDIGDESHFQLAMSGVCEQYMPLNRRSDTNGTANRYLFNGLYYGSISVETQDEGWGAGDPGTNCPWTDAQLNWLIQFGVWLCQNWGFPPTLVTEHSGAGARGFAIHRMFPQWTKSPAAQYPYKQCPGNVRDNQFRNIIMPAIYTWMNPPDPPDPPPPPPPQESDLMPPVYFKNSQGWVKVLDPYTGKVRSIYPNEYLVLGSPEAKLVPDNVWNEMVG